jgi:Protein of unknown function (DUF3999)
MNRSRIGVLALWTFGGVASAAELSPADFAFGVPVVTPAGANAYRFALPIDVYRETVREDLADIRVFNAHGEVVPYSLSRPAAAERSTFEVAGSASGTARGEYRFDLGARLPIERINLGLPELNTVIAVELLSRMRPQDPWRHVAARQFYRVNTADGELRNQPIDVATDSDRYWLARAAGLNGAPSAEPLQLQVAWAPSDIVFLARGSGPFMLTYGSALAPSAETDLSAMPTAVTVLRATLDGRRQLGGQARLAKPAEFPWKRVLLWAVLALSVCLLAWMAYRVTREMGENGPR